GVRVARGTVFFRIDIGAAAGQQYGVALGRQARDLRIRQIERDHLRLAPCRFEGRQVRWKRALGVFTLRVRNRNGDARLHRRFDSSSARNFAVRSSEASCPNYGPRSTISYSARSAVIGEIEAARSAGTMAATKAHAPSDPAATASASGS